MLKADRSRGFTILEVTIAISLLTAGMVLAMITINNRLRQENFQKGAGAFVSVINDILNDVSTNDWPSVSNFACQLDSNGNVGFTSSPGHETGDGECLYVGKVIQLGDEKSFTEEDNTYVVHTIMTHRGALIPIYNFDGIAKLNDSSRLHPLGVVEKEDPLNPGTFLFSTRDSKSWPNGMHVSQVYYLFDPSQPANHPDNKVYLRGIAVVQQSGHGLKENDLLLTVSGEGQVGLRIVRHEDIMTPNGALDPNSIRPTANEFAESLMRTPGQLNSLPSPSNTSIGWSAIEHNFNLPIYICLSDGRGNQLLATLGGSFGSLLAEIEFDETKIQAHCSY